MVTRSFSWAARDQRSFDDRFFQNLRKTYPQTCKDMKNGWDLSPEQEKKIFKFSHTSPENSFATYLHILKYADENHPLKMRSRTKVMEFMDAVFMDKNLTKSIEYYEDGISAFLKENKPELKVFTQFCSAWEIAPVLINKAIQSGGNDSGHEPI